MPLRSFVVSILLTTVLFAAFAWQGNQIRGQLEGLIRTETEAIRVAADIRYFDQARTVSTFLATHTKDTDWLERYAYPAEAAFADAEHANAVAEFFVAELLRNGTTSALVFPTKLAVSERKQMGQEQ